MRDNYHRFAAHILVGFTQFVCGLQVADGFHISVRKSSVTTIFATFGIYLVSITALCLFILHTADWTARRALRFAAARRAVHNDVNNTSHLDHTDRKDAD
jgi:hypothetical protein